MKLKFLALRHFEEIEIIIISRNKGFSTDHESQKTRNERVKFSERERKLSGDTGPRWKARLFWSIGELCCLVKNGLAFYLGPVLPLRTDGSPQLKKMTLTTSTTTPTTYLRPTTGLPTRPWSASRLAWSWRPLKATPSDARSGTTQRWPPRSAERPKSKELQEKKSSLQWKDKGQATDI